MECKLDKLSSTPATAAQKASYERPAGEQARAAVNKSTALFNRGKKAAQAESQRAFKTGAQTIRRTEAGELAALRSEYDARMNRAATNYESAVGRVEDVYDSRAASLRKADPPLAGSEGQRRRHRCAKRRSRKRSTGGSSGALKTASCSRKKLPT